MRCVYRRPARDRLGSLHTGAIVWNSLPAPLPSPHGNVCHPLGLFAWKLKTTRNAEINEQYIAWRNDMPPTIAVRQRHIDGAAT